MSEKNAMASDDVTLKVRRLACENSKFEVFFDHLVQSDGREVQDYLVVAPRARTRDMVTGVSVLPVVEGKLGLVRVYRHALQAQVWEVPRGFVDEGEDAETSALRELEEETGLVCRREDLRPLGAIAPEGGILAARVRLFAALDCAIGRAVDQEEFGHRGFRLFSSAEMDELVARGEIEDPGTLIAYLRYRNR